MKVKGTKTVLKFDPKELEEGIEMESEEHADVIKKVPKAAEMIVKAHLKETPNYYARIKKMEDKEDYDELS